MNKSYYNIISLTSEIKENANTFIISKLKEMGIEGLVTSHGSILVILYKQGPCKMSEIAQKINKKKNTVTILVDKLVKHGYVTISKDKSDKRAKIISLTDKAELIRNDFFAISDALIEKALQDIPEEDRLVLTKYLTKVRDNLT
jgi:DNA-binding MarR family transcriptional regulator